MAKAASGADVRAYLKIVPEAARDKLGGRPFVYCGGFKQHVSLYPVTAAMRRDHAGAIAPFQASKGTLKFPLDTPLPVALITRLLKTRLKELQAG
jgi:uncharacterized protein YdhG (YjbR/CyaY superfamily)